MAAAAGELLDIALARFADGTGGFFDTADDAEQLVRRPEGPDRQRDTVRSERPGQRALTYSALTGSLEHREHAAAALRIVTALGARQPRFLGWALAAAEASSRDRFRSPWSASRTGRAADDDGVAHPAAAAPSSCRGSRTPTECRWWPIVRSCAAAPRRTCVAGWSVISR